MPTMSELIVTRMFHGSSILIHYLGSNNWDVVREGDYLVATFPLDQSLAKLLTFKERQALLNEHGFVLDVDGLTWKFFGKI